LNRFTDYSQTDLGLQAPDRFEQNVHPFLPVQTANEKRLDPTVGPCSRLSCGWLHGQPIRNQRQFMGAYASRFRCGPFIIGNANDGDATSGKKSFNPLEPPSSPFGAGRVENPAVWAVNDWRHGWHADREHSDYGPGKSGVHMDDVGPKCSNPAGHAHGQMHQANEAIWAIKSARQSIIYIGEMRAMLRRNQYTYVFCSHVPNEKRNKLI
jgi:hypothetical protein